MLIKTIINWSSCTFLSTKARNFSTPTTSYYSSTFDWSVLFLPILTLTTVIVVLTKSTIPLFGNWIQKARMNINKRVKMDMKTKKNIQSWKVLYSVNVVGITLTLNLLNYCWPEVLTAASKGRVRLQKLNFFI